MANIDYIFAIISTSPIRKINYSHCIFGNDCYNAILPNER